MRDSQGFSVLELVVCLCVIGVFTGMISTNLKSLDDPLQDTSAEISSFFKQVRAKAMSSTSAYLVYPESSTMIVTEVGTSCSDPDMQPDILMRMDTPTGVILSDTSWSVCFSSRGLPDDNIFVYIEDVNYDYRSIELLLGGAVRVY